MKYFFVSPAAGSYPHTQEFFMDDLDDKIGGRAKIPLALHGGKGKLVLSVVEL